MNRASEDTVRFCPARCLECGYVLEGLLGEGAGEPRCPECGVVFSRREPWRPSNPPSARGFLWQLIAPTVVFSAVFLGLSATSAGRNIAVWPFWLVWIGVGGFFAFVWPWLRSKQLAEMFIPLRLRGEIVRERAVSALIINGITLIAAVSGFAAML
jgi:predicted RNA-binding Zn-ribbon protein involved in translation (DUF1610 family)